VTVVAVEETRGAPSAPTGTLPVPDFGEQRLSAAGLTGARDDAISRDGRQVLARERLVRVQERRAAAASVLDGARSSVRRATAAIESFEGEHGRLGRATAGIDRLADAARERLDRALRRSIEALAAGEPLPSQIGDRLVHLALVDASVPVLKERLGELERANGLSAREVAARLVQAREHVAEAGSRSMCRRVPGSRTLRRGWRRSIALTPRCRA
jgi:hypothetical protein